MPVPCLCYACIMPLLCLYYACSVLLVEPSSLFVVVAQSCLGTDRHKLYYDYIIRLINHHTLTQSLLNHGIKKNCKRSTMVQKWPENITAKTTTKGTMQTQVLCTHICASLLYLRNKGVLGLAPLVASSIFQSE